MGRIAAPNGTRIDFFGERESVWNLPSGQLRIQTSSRGDRFRDEKTNGRSIHGSPAYASVLQPSQITLQTERTQLGCDSVHLVGSYASRKISMPSLRLLIVESDQTSFDLMNDFFLQLRADVRGVEESGRAAEIVNRERFDGIFLNLDVPSTNGFDLARWIRSSSFNRSTPIVAIVGSEDRRAMKEALDSGATFYLEKPFDRQQLTNVFGAVSSSLYEHRRKFVRVPLSVDLTCSDGNGEMRGATRNLSQGGLQVAVDKLTPGDSKQLSFTLPSCSTPIEASGSVVWVGEKRQGIRFEHLNPEHRQAIDDYVTKIEAQDPPTK
jgi:DNA-binding response OmpR family regulator